MQSVKCHSEKSKRLNIWVGKNGSSPTFTEADNMSQFVDSEEGGKTGRREFGELRALLGKSCSLLNAQAAGGFLRKKRGNSSISRHDERPKTHIEEGW